MAFKLKNLPKRSEKLRSKGITLVLDKGFSVHQTEDFCNAASKYSDIVNLGNIAPSEVIPLETFRLGLRSDTLFDFYSIDDEVEDHYSDQKSASPEQNN